MIALCRYIADDTLHSLRWVAPVLVFFLFEGLLDASAGPVLPTYAASAAGMFFLAIWLTVLACTTESAIQEDITSVSVGSRARVRIAKMLVAYSECLCISALAVAVPALLTSSATSAEQDLAGAIAHSLTALFGVAIGSLCSRPIVERTAWAVLVGASVGLVDVVIPNGPPIRQVLVLLNETRPQHLLALLLLIALESVAISLVITVATLRISKLRT
jgi:hypothetical protein